MLSDGYNYLNTELEENIQKKLFIFLIRQDNINKKKN